MFGKNKSNNKKDTEIKKAKRTKTNKKASKVKTDELGKPYVEKTAS